jgi:phosphonate transport system substrate-binding protein
VDPLKDFKRTVRANHETNLLAVVNKQVDVATNNTENTHRFSLTHADQASQFREIWRSPMIASDPIVWRKDLDEGLKARVRSFMLNYGKTEREQVILQNIGYSAFRPSTNAQLIPVRQIEIARERAKVEADVNLAADERQKKLAELDARSSALDREAK